MGGAISVSWTKAVVVVFSAPVTLKKGLVFCERRKNEKEKPRDEIFELYGTLIEFGSKKVLD